MGVIFASVFVTARRTVFTVLVNEVDEHRVASGTAVPRLELQDLSLIHI